MKTQIPLGAHLVTQRTGYSHHGINIGDGFVIHYSGMADGLQSGPVAIVDIETFAAGNGFEIRTYTGSFPPDVIVQRANSRIGESAYNVFNNNCEHFCFWCCTGDHRSAQIDTVTTIGSPTVGVAAGAVARAAIASGGAVAGLSGAGVMSGLASTGALVGGGAAAGIAILGGGPAALTALAVNKTVLADSPALNKVERGSRKAGRAASYAAAAGGTAGGIAVVSAAGTTAGLSAAGITSGLSVIGGVIGGGMATGAFIVTAAPALLAVAGGYGVYKIVRWIKS